MDDTQKWAVSAARAALVDAGWPDWKVDPQRVAVIIGNAIGGEKHYASNLRIQLPEFMQELVRSPAFAGLPAGTRETIASQTTASFLSHFPDINEDTMPGELANILAGRVANLFNFRGPSFTTDAACASALAAINAAVEGLLDGQYDVAVTGGIDRNNNVAAFVKFCKIGALSATGTRPFDAGADGFVMGEGAALFILKRLADAERDGDRIYAVLLGTAGASDGKGKGITAPNPVGQRLAVERAWRNAGADPSHGDLDRGAWHLDPRRRRLRAGEPERRFRRRRPGLDRAGLGEVERRSPEGSRRRGRTVQAGHVAARQGAAAEPELP